VVLMLENRSFDHLLGYLKANGIKPAVDGLTGTETNPTIPPATGPVMVTAAAGDGEPKPDSGHELADVSEQFYGHVDLVFPPNGPMNGFVANYAKQPANGADIMKCVDPANIPALVELAKEFCVCDRWHASVPGSTWPNRMFAHAATSAGTVTNVLNLYLQPTIFDRLTLAGRNWRIYYHQIPQAVLFASLFAEWIVSPITHRFRFFRRWKNDLAAPGCSLPEYTFIEPRYFSIRLGTQAIDANDQHPSHPISAADQLVRDVYEPLRASPCWAHSMLIVVHEEHGGTYDHRFPDIAAVNPDGLVSSPSGFPFTRYGARVPAEGPEPSRGQALLAAADARRARGSDQDPGGGPLARARPGAYPHRAGRRRVRGSAGRRAHPGHREAGAARQAVGGAPSSAASALSTRS